MNYRFYITALSSRVEVFPLNWRSCSLVDSREKGAMYYRRTFSGSLMFTDNNGGDDFSLLYLIEATSPCERLILEIEQKDSGADTYHNYWTGYFSTPDGAFDLDRSTFTITPKPYDSYINFDLYGETQYNILAGVTTKVTCNTTAENYQRCMLLVDVIEYLTEQVFGLGTTVTSWFLNNATNPVLLDKNKYRYLTILQKSDAKRPDATNWATRGMMSLSEMMNILNVMYKLLWTYDGTTVRIEHYSYWDSIAGLDLRTQPISARQNKYSYLKTSMPYMEKFRFMEAEDANYTEHFFKYDENCTDVKNTTDFSLNVTTDIEYIETCVADQYSAAPKGLISNISDEGWVILANEPNGLEYDVYYGAAFESGDASYNFVNSWSYLLRAFHLHGRVLMNGYINATAVDFISARKTIKQEIKAIVCYEDDYMPEDYITTELGEDYLNGKKGYVDTATIHPDGHVEFVLLYGEDTNKAVEIPAAPKSVHCVISNLNCYTYLSEPSTVDLYFWILLDGTDCSEIMIPAGTVYVYTLLADPGGPAPYDYKFNIELLISYGWSMFLNENEAYDRITDASGCPAVPPAPPAVPAPPVLNGASQGDFCDPIVVNWNVSAGATYYKIFRNPDKFMNPGYGLLTTELTDTYYDYDGGEEHGTTFYYKVQACNVSGCSADSNEVDSDVIWCPHG